MDRLSFIHQKYVSGTDSSRCVEEYCKCEETNLRLLMKGPQKGKLLHLAVIPMLSFLCAAFIVLVKNDVATEATLHENKRPVISCRPGNSIDARGKNVFYGDPRATNDNNGNTCPHQLGASGTLCIADSKRKRNHEC